MKANEKAAFAKRLAGDVFGPDALKLLVEGLPCKPGTRGHGIAFASDGRTTVGKRDAGPWVDGIAMVRAADEHARWFGGGVVNRQPTPRRRAMTQSQRECLEGQP